MANCLPLLLFLTSGFVQKWYLPQGNGLAPTKMQIADTDRDGNTELIFTTYGSWPAYIHFYELHLPNTWEIDSVPLSGGDLLWDSGDFDSDGFYDLALDFHIENPSLADGIMIFESPDSFSYPTQEVWRDTVDIGTVQPICAFDIDKDGFPEIVQTGGEAGTNHYIDFSIYECTANNTYEVKYYYESPETPTSPIAFGDFDGDSLNEFVMGTIEGQYSIFESPANDSYVPLFVNVQLPTANIMDCFDVSDMDGDGKLEFVLKGFTVLDARTHAFIFEATANNTYQIIKSWTLPDAQGWDYYGGYSDVGDIDGDGRVEIALEAASYVYLIKAVSNDSFIIWHTLPGNRDGSSVRVFDIDGNGLSEVIISGGNHTSIYEKTPFVTWFCPTPPCDTFYANDTVYPRWRLDETISLDSLRLYWSHPQLGCHLIYQGLPTDTTCLWVVPDTQSNITNRFWLVTKGSGRYDSTYSPVFYIKRRQGIEETEFSQFPNPHLQLTIYPNPFHKTTVISYSSSVIDDKLLSPTLQVYDATGRLVKRFHHLSCPNKITWDGTGDAGCPVPAGVYFVQFNFDEYKKVAKVVKLE